MRGLAGVLAVALLAPLLAGCVASGADTDGDKLSDTDEAVQRHITVRMANGTESRTVTSDPRLADTDADGLDDWEEAQQGTDPRDVDTDGDGLLDGRDLRPEQGSPLSLVLAARGIVRGPDGRFLGEADAGSKPFDWDGDRPFPDLLGDGVEVGGWNVTVKGKTVHVTSDPTTPDTDRDGLSDFEEHRRACDPRSNDTDLDGTSDAVDADCTHDLRARLAVTAIGLNRSLDPVGDTDLQLLVQVASLQRTHAQALKVGVTNVTFRWDVDLPDNGLWHDLRVPMVLEFWDTDLAGDDPDSGVQRQPIRVVGEGPAGNVLTLDLDVFQGRWTTPQGLSGGAQGHTTGPDGWMAFTLEPVFE